MFQQDHYINHLIQNNNRQKESNQPQFFRGKIASLSVLQDHGNAMLTNTSYTVEVIDTMNADGSPLLIGGCIILASNAGPFGFGDRDPLTKGTPVVCLSLRGDYRDVFILGTFKAYGDYTKFFQQGISTKPGEAQEGKFVNTSTYSIYPPMVGLPNSKTELIPKYKPEYETKFKSSELAENTPELGGLNLQNNFNGDTLHYTVGKQLFYADEDILLLSGVAGKSRCDSFKELSVFYNNYADALEKTFIKASGIIDAGVKAEAEVKEDPLFKDSKEPKVTKQVGGTSNSSYSPTDNKSAAESSMIVGAKSNTFLKRFEKNDADFREWAVIDYHVSELRTLAKKYAEDAVTCEQNQSAQVLSDAISDKPKEDACSTTKDTENKTDTNPIVAELISKYSLTNLGVYKLENKELKLVLGHQYSPAITTTGFIEPTTASPLKLLIAAEIVKKNPDLSTELILDNTIAYIQAPGYKNTIRGCLTRMLKESTNDDANMLVKYVLGGEVSFNNLIKASGYGNSSFSYFRAIPQPNSPTKNSSCSSLCKALGDIINAPTSDTKAVCLEALKTNNFIAGYSHHQANKVGFISSKIADTAWIKKDNVDYLICIYLGLQGNGWDNRKVKIKEAIDLITNSLDIPADKAKICNKTPTQVNLGAEGNIRDRGTVPIIPLPAKEDRIKKDRVGAIARILLHNTIVSLAESVAAYKGLEGYEDKKVAAHYTVARNGNVYQHVQDKDIALQVNHSINDSALGIEIEATLANPYMTAKQEQALISLIKEKLKQYSLPKSFVLAHRDVVTNTECPNLIWLFSNTPEKLKKNHPHGDFKSWIDKNL